MEYLFLQTCCSKERIKASIERDRCIVIGIETNDKNFSAPSKVSFNQNFLKYLGNPNNKFLVVIFFVKAIIRGPFFAIVEPHCRHIPGICPNLELAR